MQVEKNRVSEEWNFKTPCLRRLAAEIILSRDSKLAKSSPTSSIRNLTFYPGDDGEYWWLIKILEISVVEIG
jgi:hypothetical protein